MASPYHLPIELWQMIWKELADDNCKRKHLGRHPHVHYAAINRDWQNYFESLHFRQLILSTPECISALNQNVPLRRRRLVQRIWLRVHLFNPEQPMTFGLDLLGTRQPDMKTENSRVLSSAVRRLFFALSKWSKDEANYGRGITLELTIHSDSHGEDRGLFSRPKAQNISRFNPFEWTGRECLNGDESWRFLSQGPIGRAPSDVVHGSQYRSQHGEGMSLGRLGVYITPLDFMNPSMNRSVLDSWPSGLVIHERLRPCNAITGFVMRREYHQCISPHGLGTILDKLPALGHMSHEMWYLDRNVSSPYRNLLDREYVVLLRRRLPPLLRRLSLFQDFDKLGLVHHLMTVPSSRRDLPPPALSALGHALAKSSRNLEELSLAFIVDAKDFLYQFSPLSETGVEAKKKWKNLTTLSLTSSSLRDPRQSAQPIRDLLEAAGNAARIMPKLETMEIWNALSGEGAVFRYDRRHGGNGSPAITWTTSWSSDLDPRVIAAWERAIPEKEKLMVNTRLMVAPQSYGSLLHLLKLRDRMLHPVSLFQIELAMKNISP